VLSLRELRARMRVSFDRAIACKCRQLFAESPRPRALFARALRCEDAVHFRS
jgi:hypothetical protein